MKNREFGKEAPQEFLALAVQSERPLPIRQGASGHENIEEKPTLPKTDSSSGVGIEPWFEDGLRFKCTGCGKCCTGSPGYVFLSKPDLEKLSAHFHLSEEAFLQKYCRFIDGQYALLDRAGSYDCIFLKDNQCSAYEARPIQCRTFPWWIQNLRDEKDWEEASQRCEGINHPEAPLIPSLKIQEQCLTYLDNLLAQNFDL